MWSVAPEGEAVLRLILNVIWLILEGLWMAIAYVLAGLVAFILIITIPFGIAAFRIAGYVLWPFGRTIDRRPEAGIASVEQVGTMDDAARRAAELASTAGAGA